MSIKKPFNKHRVGIIYGKRQARKVWFGSDANFMGVRFFLPRSLYNTLMAYRASKGVPIARLVAIAVFKEIICRDPFKLKMKAESEFEASKYNTEATKIYEFLNENKGGMAKDLLVMSRHHIGIADEDSFLHGIQELLEIGLIEEVISVEGSDTPWVQIKNFASVNPYEVKRRLGK